MSMSILDNNDDTLERFSELIDEPVSVVAKEEARFLGKENFKEIWEIETGLYDDENHKWLVEELRIYIAFKNDFPYSLPKIYINNGDLLKIGFIPHVTYLTGNVCVSDEFVIVDDKQSANIVLFQYNKAKQTLVDGLKGKNHSDFEDEFIAYWETIQDKSDNISFRQNYTLIDDEPSDENDVQLIFYRRKGDEKEKYTSIIYNEKESLINPYLEYLEQHNYDIVKQECFYIGEETKIKTPPFTLKCEDSISYIPPKLLPSFKNYFNKAKPFRIVIFKKVIVGNEHYFGWQYPKTATNFKGFRRGKVTPYKSTFSKLLPTHNKSVTRFSSDKLNEERLTLRTASDNIKIPKYSFLIAGIGSVGSLLVQNLNTVNFPNLTLIDNDKLSLENIKRHTLGFSEVGKNKAKATRDSLLSKMPTQNINVYEKSFFDIFGENINTFNNQDYIFLAIGKRNIERWFIEEQIKGNIVKPIFVLWVEPYLLGGHCIYLHPESNRNVDELFYDIYKFKYSIINPDELEIKRKLFTLKESGCQTNFSPYSNTHLSLFMSSVHEKIYKTIESGSTKSVVFSWVGDYSIAYELGIKLNVQNDVSKYSLIENEI